MWSVETEDTQWFPRRQGRRVRKHLPERSTLGQVSQRNTGVERVSDFVSILKLPIDRKSVMLLLSQENMKDVEFTFTLVLMSKK